MKHPYPALPFTMGGALIIVAVIGCVRAQDTPAIQEITPASETKRNETRLASNRTQRPAEVLTGADALGDWTTDAPGVRRKIIPADLPKPYATPHVDNGPHLIRRPEDEWPKAPKGFVVEEFATGLNNPRVIVTAPNGDLFVAESDPNRVRVLRDADGDGKPEVNEVFAEGLVKPFGIAFYPPGPNPQYVYVANTDSVVRFPYKTGDTRASSAAETIVNDIPGGGRLRGGGHWTRDILFTRDGKRMLVSVGSFTNVHENPNIAEDRRAAILSYDPDGKNYRLFASGIRNPVTLALHPRTGDVWTSVNERDTLGDHLVPDYITRVKEGGFYGWPWYYIGPNEDPHHEGKHPELRDKVLIPDVLLQSHSASLGMTFYTGSTFPRAYQQDAFAALHGSWNRSRRTGYKVIRVPLQNGKPTGEYEDFLTGFVTQTGDVWGRPVDVTFGKDGALYVTDDGGNLVRRVKYTGSR